MPLGAVVIAFFQYLSLVVLPFAPAECDPNFYEPAFGQDVGRDYLHALLLGGYELVDFTPPRQQLAGLRLLRLLNRDTVCAMNGGVDEPQFPILDCHICSLQLSVTEPQCLGLTPVQRNTNNKIFAQCIIEPRAAILDAARVGLALFLAHRSILTEVMVIDNI